MTRVSLTLTVAAVAALVAAPALASDKIQKTAGGKALVVDQVTQDQWDAVKYKKGAVEVPENPSKIRQIVYGDAPEKFELGVDKRDAGEFENAVTLLKAAESEKGVRPWIKVYAPYELGKTYLLWGSKEKAKFGDAVREFDRALQADQKTRLRPQILYHRAKAQLAAGAVDKAIADLDLLGKESIDNKYGITWEIKAGFEKAETLDQAGKNDEAKREYSRLETNCKSFMGRQDLEESERSLAAETAGLARLAQGRVLIRDNKLTDAERFFTAITDDKKEVESVQASAWVGKGMALQAQKKLKDAQLAYARAKIWFANAPDAVAEATYRLGLVTEELAAQTPPTEPKGAKLAQDYYKEVVARFPGSRFAQMSREKIR